MRTNIEMDDGLMKQAFVVRGKATKKEARFAKTLRELSAFEGFVRASRPLLLAARVSIEHIAVQEKLRVSRSIA
jgi:hypothetical protein